MRWLNFWEIFWISAVLVAPMIGWAVGVGLRYWLGLPAWAVAISPLFGEAALFGVVWLLVRLDDRRRRRAEPGAAPDRDRF